MISVILRMLMLFIVIFSAATTLAQKLPPSGLKLDAWMYEKIFNSSLLLCHDTGYWIVDKVENRGIRSYEEIKKLEDCVQSGRAEAKKQFNTFREKMENETAKTALKDHYIAWIKTFEELNIQTGESLQSYNRRYKENQRQVRALWIRFQVEIE